MAAIIDNTNIPTPTQTTDQDTTPNRVSLRIGNTTFLLGLHFSKTSKLTLEDKIKKLIRRDMEISNF